MERMQGRGRGWVVAGVAAGVGVVGLVVGWGSRGHAGLGLGRVVGLVAAGVEWPALVVTGTGTGCGGK